MARIEHTDEAAEKEFKEGINKGKLKELRAFLRAGDREPVEGIMRDIDRYQYGDIDTEFLTALREYLNMGDYQTSSEMIDQYLIFIFLFSLYLYILNFYILLRYWSIISLDV